ncbi:hypothetical protein DUNSADRAFT_1706 [Dunaliella salina]|uniref:FAD dependent oxidoreductase domain-containing protein n=1 Tax=Dunaliella salina TaxID=3046 RepID=A0ABQ7FX57_DUNSA|nr:hypothetical protein DUNSADRAFT_1706 [Dunaliella salina]|eukprot:KAF5826940.1 hypothetical protein DUNSADRAFT_1706 [Dunaliella salina]
MRVRAPWIRSAYMCGDTYIIPNRESVVLGGTGQVDDYCLEARAEERERIWQKCCALLPSLAQSEVLHDWVGLRPGRTRVRLEAEVVEVSLPYTEQSSSGKKQGGSEDCPSGPSQDSDSGSSRETPNSHSSDWSKNSSRHGGNLDGISAGQSGGNRGSGKKSVRVPVVHCYGHGGAGLTLGWGCAGDVVVLVQSLLQRGMKR